MTEYSLVDCKGLQLCVWLVHLWNIVYWCCWICILFSMCCYSQMHFDGTLLINMECCKEYKCMMCVSWFDWCVDWTFWGCITFWFWFCVEVLFSYFISFLYVLHVLIFCSCMHCSSPLQSSKSVNSLAS